MIMTYITGRLKRQTDGQTDGRRKVLYELNVMKSVQLQDHKKEHESGYYQCEECEKYFNDENQLEEHMKRKHKFFLCDECEKVFMFEVLLEKHKTGVHEDL